MVHEMGKDFSKYLLHGLLTQRTSSLLIHNMYLYVCMAEFYLLMLESLLCESLSVILYNVFYVIPLTLHGFKKINYFKEVLGSWNSWTEGTEIFHIFLASPHEQHPLNTNILYQPHVSVTRMKQHQHIIITSKVSVLYILLADVQINMSTPTIWK